MMTTYQNNRQRLPETRRAVIHAFSVGDHRGYIRVGLFEDGRPGEIFVDLGKVGSTMSGLIDALAIMTSLALQSGIPLQVIARKFEGQKYPPSGYTANPEIPYAESIPEYVFRWLALKFPEPTAAPATTQQQTTHP